MPFSAVRTALSSVKNVSRRVIKPVGVLVFSENHIFIPMHDFDTPVPTVESQYLDGISFLRLVISQTDSFSVFVTRPFLTMGTLNGNTIRE